MSEKPHDRMPSHNVDDLFRSAIEPFEEAPSAGVWENVEKDLDRYNIISIKRKYYNFKKIAVALVLILSSALLYELQTQHHIFKKSAVGNTVIKDDLSTNNVDSNINTKENAPVLAASDLPQSSRLSNTPVKNHNLVTIDKLNATLSASGNGKRSFDQNLNVTSRRSYESSVFTPYLKVDRNNKVSSEQIVSDNSYSAIPVSKNAAGLISSTLPSVIDLLPENTHAILYNNAFNLSKNHQSPVVNAVDGHKLSGFARSSPFSLSLIFSPDFTSRLVKEDWPVNREDKLEEIRKSERYAFSYSLGALVDYRRNKHWAIQSGFTLSRAVINIDPKFIFARPDDLGDVKFKFNSSSGYSYLSPHSMSRPAFGDSLHAFRSTSSLLYLSIPLSLKYNIARKKVNLYASAGAAANILIKDKIETSLGNMMNREDAVNHNIKGLKPVYYSALLAAGVSYNISKKIAVSFTPTTRLALTSINKDAPVKSYQQSVGLVAGVQISL